MDFCPYKDAFPDIGGAAGGGGQVGPTTGIATAAKEERKAKKRHSKKCKLPPLEYAEDDYDPAAGAPAPFSAGVGDPKEPQPPDPDRLFVKPPVTVPSLQEIAEAFLDASGAIPGPKNVSPVPCLFNTSTYPSYFGKGVDDDDELTEGFAGFTNVIGDDPTYRLVPDDGKGLAKAAGSAVLPVPSVVDVWKPMTPTGSYTANFSSLPAPGGRLPRSTGAGPDYKRQQENLEREVGPTAATNTGAGPDASRDVLLKRIDELFGRLEDLERRRVRDTQKEVLMFVGTGLFVLLSLEIVTRRRVGH